MNNSTTNIEYKKVSDSVLFLNTSAKKLEDILTDFDAEMRKVNTEEVFRGMAATALEAKYTVLKGKFGNYVEKIREFALAYEKASGKTADTEKSIEKTLDNIGGDNLNV